MARRARPPSRRHIPVTGTSVTSAVPAENCQPSRSGIDPKPRVIPAAAGITYPSASQLGLICSVCISSVALSLTACPLLTAPA